MGVLIWMVVEVTVDMVEVLEVVGGLGVSVVVVVMVVISVIVVVVVVIGIGKIYPSNHSYSMELLSPSALCYNVLYWALLQTTPLMPFITSTVSSLFLHTPEEGVDIIHKEQIDMDFRE